MDADATERERRLEARLGALEARLRQLEGKLGLEPEPPAAIPPAPPLASALPPPPPPPPVAPTYWRTSQKEPQTPAGPVNWNPVPPSSQGSPSIRRGIASLGTSLPALEERLTGRALAWVGGAALILGATLFLGLAFSRGWIGPELRILMGLVGGSAALAGGAAFLERQNRLLGLVLTPVGLAIISISLVAATRLYGFVPVGVGLAGALASAIAAAVIAVRANSQIVAGFGLVAVLIAPPIMGASPDVVTLLFVAVVLAGTTGVALWRSWSWLPPVAFILSAPQAASWIGNDPEPVLGLAGIGLFWLFNIVAAGGEAFRRRRDDLSTSSASLLLANAAFLVWAGFALLDGDLTTYRGLFLVLVALAHIAIGGAFVVRDGEQNLFGLLTIGTGIAALTMAPPIQLGAPAVPIAWTAEAVALAWLAARRGHPYSALVSGLLFALAGGALLSVYRDLEPPSSGIPLADAAGASLGFFVAGVAAGVWLVRDRSLRSALAAYGLLVVAACVSRVLDPPSSVIGLTLLTFTGTAVWRALPILPSTPIAWQTEGLIPRMFKSASDWRGPTASLLPIAVVLLLVAATTQLVGRVYGSAALEIPPGVPFVNPAGAALALYLIGLVAVAWVSGRSRLREPLGALGLLVTAWACLSEFDGVALVAAWASLMVLVVSIWRTLAALPHEAPMALEVQPGVTWTLDLVLPFAALVVGAWAAIHVLAIELPLARLGRVLPPEIPFTDGGAAAALILIVAVLATAALVGGALARRVAILVAGGVLAYAIPYEVYAWAVSVLWVGLAGLALVLSRLDRGGQLAFIVAAMSLVAAAATVAIAIVAPPSRLVVGSQAIAPVVVLQSIAALGAAVAGLVAIARTAHTEAWARWVWIGAAVLLTYLLSIAVVGAIATQVGGAIETDELRTQGQVALSVLWAVLGLTAFVTGLRLRADDLRRGALALLALATAKVFLFDLSALDVAYRVISLICLGLLLLAGAWVWQRLQPRPSAEGNHPGG